MTHRVLVFGQSGQVATALRRRCGTSLTIRAVGRGEADLRAPRQAARLIARWAPDAVINAAAYTAVDRAEAEERLAHRINAEAPGVLAAAAAASGIPFVHVSTDYVFDGTGSRPWTEADAPAPLNAYGRSKLAGERAVLAAHGGAAVLRTSWVFSATGGNFVRTMLRAGATRPVLQVVDDQWGGPTPAEDIADALVIIARALIEGRGAPGLYHFQGAPATTWAGFARAIFDAAGWRTAPRVAPIATADWPAAAARPLNGRLDCTKIRQSFGIGQPDWRLALPPVLDGLAEIAA